MLTRKRRRELKNLLGRAPAPVRDRIGGLLLRGYERYLALRAGSQPVTDNGLPVPPAHLRVKVVGHGDAEQFLRTGRREHQLVRETVRRVEGALPLPILDWGCGCGRLARWWDIEIHGCDYNPALVRWVNHNLPHVRAQINELRPPLPYAHETFRLVYGLSVLTHLDDELALLWAREIRRVLKPGGVFFFTMQGRAHADRLSPQELERFGRGESVVQFGAVQGTNLCAAYRTQAWIESNLLQGMDLVDVVEGHTDEVPDMRQDRYLVRKR